MLDPKDKLIDSENVFWGWFNAAFAAHSTSTPCAEDFLNVGTPFRAQGEKKSGFEPLYKRTVLIPPGSQGNPNAFSDVLLNYLIDNLLMLYADSVRLAVDPQQGVAVFKDCGPEVGGLFCDLSREGNIFTFSVTYQVYKKKVSILSSPRCLKNISDSSAIHECEAARDYRASVGSGAVGFWLVASCGCLSLMYIALALLYPRAFRNFPEGFAYPLFLAAGIFSIISVPVMQCLSKRNDEKLKCGNRAFFHLIHDLSPIYFPVAHFGQEHVVKAIASNHDHQVFIERVSNVIERAVSLAEHSG